MSWVHFMSLVVLWTTIAVSIMFPLPLGEMRLMREQFFLFINILWVYAQLASFIPEDGTWTALYMFLTALGAALLVTTVADVFGYSTRFHSRQEKAMTLTFEIQKIEKVGEGRFQVKIVVRDTTMGACDTLVLTGTSWLEAKNAALDAVAGKIR